MRRVGSRGGGDFERVSWDAALDEVAAQINRVRREHGNATMLNISRTGSLSMLHGRNSVQRMFNRIGGCTVLWSNISAEAEVFALRRTYGRDVSYLEAGREPTDYVNSKLIWLWGWSPADGTFGTGTLPFLKTAKAKGTRMVVFDPRVTRTSRALADEHVFVRPGTDAAALIAMAYVIVTEGLHDQAYLDRYVLGFDEDHMPAGAPAGGSYRSYLLGEIDSAPKTPAWAEAITGIAAGDIQRLALELAATKPAAIQCGFAPGRTEAGEQFHRAAYALSAITGNVGVPGGNSGSSNGVTGNSGVTLLPTGEDPLGARVASPLLADLLTRGRAGGYPADIKLLYSMAGDLFNQCPNTNKTLAALDGVEFFVAQDNFLTPTSRHADIVLPATTYWERNDVHTPWSGAGHYAIFMAKAIEPMGECRNDFDILADLANRLGIEDFSGKSEIEWLRELTKDAVDDFERFRADGLARFVAPRHAVAFADFIADPDAHPLMTPSGKIEIYSMMIASDPDPYGLGEIPAIPTWTDEEPANQRPDRFPLMLCSPKSRARTHSTHGNQPRLARVDPDDVWINPGDAAARGIGTGDLVEVFNEFGRTRLKAHVTDRILAGVVAIKEGAWFQPDASGLDLAGCANAVSADRTSPAGASTYNSNRVEIARA
jgi:anaerobic dimethyl sulfoxide reductase subunit A